MGSSNFIYQISFLIFENKYLPKVKFKCWYYEQALADGNEDRLKTYTETPQD